MYVYCKYIYNNTFYSMHNKYRTNTNALYLLCKNKIRDKTCFKWRFSSCIVLLLFRPLDIKHYFSVITRAVSPVVCNRRWSVVCSLSEQEGVCTPWWAAVCSLLRVDVCSPPGAVCSLCMQLGRYRV